MCHPVQSAAALPTQVFSSVVAIWRQSEAETLSEIHLVTPITPAKRGDGGEERREKMICEEIDKGVSAAVCGWQRRTPSLPPRTAGSRVIFFIDTFQMRL